MSTLYYVVPEELHNHLVRAAYLQRGYSSKEAEDAVKMALAAALHGIHTHNAIRALLYDTRYGKKLGACIPKAEISVLPRPFQAVQTWNGNRKLGQAIAYQAMDTCIELADKFGVGIVAVDNCFHYFWGGAYVLHAAEKGYIAYTACTGPVAEVVPYQGKFPTLGTNPHSWGFPTTQAIGYPILIDWATSLIARGKIELCQREGKPLPEGAALDAQGVPTRDPSRAASLLPFGAHKGYSMGLLDEIYAAFIGGSLPTVRGTHAKEAGEKYTTSFLFQVVHPDAISGRAFAKGRTQQENIKAVLDDILGHGNTESHLPGFNLSQQRALSKKLGGLLFTPVEMQQFQEIAQECGLQPWDPATFTTVEI